MIDMIDRGSHSIDNAGSIGGNGGTGLVVAQNWQDLWRALLPRLEAANSQPPIVVRDPTDNPVWGVSWVCSAPPLQVVNLYNILLRRLELPLLRCLFLCFLSATKMGKCK